MDDSLTPRLQATLSNILLADNRVHGLHFCHR